MPGGPSVVPWHAPLTLEQGPLHRQAPSMSPASPRHPLYLAQRTNKSHHQLLLISSSMGPKAWPDTTRRLSQPPEANPN